MHDTARAGLYSWREITASAYRAYAASTGNKNYQGNPMPAFDDLPQAIQTAWEAAVRHAHDVKICGHSIIMTDEERQRSTDPARWTGWVPPHLKG